MSGAAETDGAPGQHRAGRKIQQRFERLLALSRLLTLIPVVFLLLDAAGSFVYGADILVRTADGDVGEPSRVGGRLGIFLIVMDTFLVGATLMIAAFGFYELFVLRRERPGHAHWLPGWLVMHDLEDLKARVVSMLILVAAITFVDILVESHDEHGILFLGLGIAVLIIALTAFLMFGRKTTRAMAAVAEPGQVRQASGAGPAEARPAPSESPPAGPGTTKPGRTVVAIAGYSSLDLRENRTSGALASGGAAPQITVRLIAFLGQITIMIPAGMRVTDSGLTLLGTRAVAGDASQAGSGAPALVTTGVCVLARIKIARAVSQA